MTTDEQDLDPDLVAFGERLRVLREKRGLSQEQLGEVVGRSHDPIRKYENGTSDAKGQIVAKLARFFGVSADYLLGLADEENPEAYMRPGDIVVDLDALERIRAAETPDDLEDIAEDPPAWVIWHWIVPRRIESVSPAKLRTYSTQVAQKDLDLRARKKRKPKR